MTADFSQDEEKAVLKSDRSCYEAQLAIPEPGLAMVIVAGKVYSCALEKNPDGSSDVIVNGRRIPVFIQDPKRLSHGVGEGNQAGGRAILTSPMPGKIVRILLQPGDEVDEGQGVIVVEAMKMQNEVQSPKKGKIIELEVIEGQAVNAGEKLVVIE